MPRALLLFTAVSFLLLLLISGPPAQSEEGSASAKADKLFQEKNYLEAAKAYEAILVDKPAGALLHHASRRVVSCYLRLELFGPALEASEAYIGRTKDTPYEARAERFCGNLYLTVPHWGTRAGGVFHRAQWKQGIQLQSWRHDKKHALAHLDRARNLYAAYDAPAGSEALAALTDEERAGWHDERIGCLFDLTGAVARFGIYEPEFQYWYSYWGERDDDRAETAGEDDFDEYYGGWELRRKRPIGLRLDGSGKPIFAHRPDAYAPDLSDDQKILYLLGEIRDLDRTAEKKFAALSYYRQAMLARARFGMDRLNQYAGMYWAGNAYPLQEELETFHPWELGDSEALVLAGGRVQVVTLPSQWDVMGLLRTVYGDYDRSGVAPQSRYALGLYHQSRQQYLEALAAYGELRKVFPKDAWTERAVGQEELIRQPQVRISQTGVQLPDEPARLQLSYRNTTKIHFVARHIDLLGFFREIRRQPVHAEKGFPWFWSLGNWAYLFVNGSQGGNWVHTVAARHVGAEVARWSDDVEDDGTHRYAQAHVQSPLDRAGAYLVYAYLQEPPASDAKASGQAALGLGASRAVVVLTDLALVDKPAKDGMLYFVADARTGAPVEKTSLDVLEVWSTWNQKRKKSDYFKEERHLETNAKGLTLDPRPRRQMGQLHVLARQGQGDEMRLAWSGMTYWNHYSPSGMRDGVFAYVITDRPVYRPLQTVRYKVWLRHRRMGIYGPLADQSITVRIFDTKGNKVAEARKRTDAFGGLDGEMTLGEEPRLGVYRIQVDRGAYVGGQNFRVEEYKKPEFEVTVEPGTTHAKLGQKIEAKITAAYYFGAPVTDARVQYKVFREEYRHRAYPYGIWDWLYGAGYGYAWYDADWWPWWGSFRGCCLPPTWWWGFFPGYGAWKPVRELVAQGEGRIGEDGTFDVDLDTAAALRDHGDRDHRYVIQAEVRDASRRVITGEGSVKVTRQAYYANVWADRGWIRPGEEFVVTVRCLTPDNEPVETEGVLTVSDVVFGGPDNAKIEETQLERFTVKTDERGEATLRLRHEKSGQLKIHFQAPDAWGGTVDGYGLVWVVGRDFDGRLHRFNDLELLTDKRTYAPGEVAHVMINTRQSDSWVLFSDDVDNNTLLSWRMLHLPRRSTVIDVPIEKGDQPNFFVEAMTVRDTRVHQQAKRICVPPEKGVIDVAVKTDKPEYGPGDEATLEVEATNLDGSPAHAQLTVSAFDKSVLYIQPEMTPRIRKFFHGHLRHHQPQMRTNLLQQFAAWGYVHRPFQQLGSLPPAWRGVWGPVSGSWRTFAQKEGRLAGGAEEAETLDAMAESPGEREPSDPCAPASAAAPAGDDRGGGGARARSKLAEQGAIAGAKGGGRGAGADLVEAEMRTKFADTALWATTLTTGEDGKAKTTFTCPENLTTWKINVWGMTKGTRVGQASTSAVTTKNLIVRLQAPRFFQEYDEVVLSANVHNYLAEEKVARVSLVVPEKLLELVGDAPLTVDVEVPAGGERRVDWRVRVTGEGQAKIAVKALTDEESDAMQLTFPVLVHGMMKQVARTGSMRPQDLEKTLTVELDVPAERRPELSRLEVQFAPSLVGAMLDALPYCLHYPYGCTEQTMSRFVPAVLTLKTLRNMGLRLEDLREVRRGRMEEIRRIEKGENRRIWSAYADSVVFDDAELQRIVDKSLARIANMQHGDGGWGWWTNDRSSGYLTSYVVWALLTAQHADVAVDQNMVQRGLQFLKRWEEQEMQKKGWGPHAQHAFVAHVLSSKSLRAVIKPGKDDKRPGDLVERLWLGRDQLGLYGKALLTLAMSNLKDARARTVLQNIMQYKEENAETQVAWFRMPTSGWWYWWNSDIETTAWILRALVRLEPESPVAPRVVKWLLNNRKNGYYWRSTRDTTMCVAAMSDFVTASGEGQPDYTLRLDLDDGAVVKEVKISKANFFTYDNRFVVEGVALTGGTHTLKITKTGPGALYLNTYLSYFTKERHIGAAGHELKVQRTYFRLKQIPYEIEVEGAEGQTLKEKRLRYERIPVKNGDEVKSGDILQVELEVTSDNDYTYLCCEDMKPAGCEPVDLRSGGKGQEGFWSNMELRDEKTVFFVSALGQGEHLLRYRLRAEIPGVFHALPTRLFAMYVPELKANADEIVIRIVD